MSGEKINLIRKINSLENVNWLPATESGLKYWWSWEKADFEGRFYTYYKFFFCFNF